MGPPRRKHNRTEKVKRAGRLQFSFASFFTLIYVAGPLESRWRSEERTYAHSILKGEARARGGCPWAGRAFLALNNRSRSAAERHGAEGKEQPYVIEYYYKAKWGHAEEFLSLFKKNHYPVLKKEMELGRMLKVSMTVPRYHTTEDGRWDYRVTIVFKSAAIANDNFDSSA